MTDEQRIARLRERLALRRKSDPDIPVSLARQLSSWAKDEAIEVIAQVEVDALEWVLREIFGVTP